MKEYNDMSEHPVETFSFNGKTISFRTMNIINQYILNQKAIVVDITFYHDIAIRGEKISCIDLDISGPIENIEELAQELGAVWMSDSSEYYIEKEKP